MRYSHCALPASLRPSRKQGTRAFSLVETLVACCLSLIAVTAFFASAGQAIRMTHVGRENVYASQMLQERMDAFRSASSFTKVTTVAGVRSLVTNATNVAANFPAATETFTVSTYYPTPAAPTPAPLVVTRTPSGALSSAGATPVPNSAVKVSIQTSWTGTGGVARSRQLSTIMSSNGVK